jgi:DNA-nicking Smr family endonuclease
VRRSLSREETALWARLAGTVAPIKGRTDHPSTLGEGKGVGPVRLAMRQPSSPTLTPPKNGRGLEDLRTRPQTLDANWDRKLAHGLVSPDFTLDLHGHSLDAAHARLDQGLTLAAAQGARLVLLITGKPRPGDGAAGRGDRRGAIRAKFADWLALGSHASRIAAIRPAHPRHGGAGAVYVVLRRAR